MGQAAVDRSIATDSPSMAGLLVIPQGGLRLVVKAGDNLEGKMAIAKRPTIKSGQMVPDSGIYRSNIRTPCDLVAREPAPPTPLRREKWLQVIDTNPDDDK